MLAWNERTVTRRKTVRCAVVLLSLLLVVLTATSCGEAWGWLWSRDAGESVNTNDMILGDGNAEEETDLIFEGAVEYTGETHSGTDIYYLGKAGSPNRNRIIVIDAGHQLKGSSALEPNGPDSEVMKAEVSWGATGVYTGQTEYELNLKVALLLRDELIRRGYSVVMIRETNNVQISNMKRAEIANKYSAAAYVRIHANSWTDDSMRGAMTICQSASNPYPSCAAHYQKSCRLSDLVLDEFCAQTGIAKLNRREMDDMTGTNWSRVPTTIVEMGFLSNKSDDSLMSTDYFRQEAAIGIANGLDAYFEWLELLESEEETTDGGKTTESEPRVTASYAEESLCETTAEPIEKPAEGKDDTTSEPDADGELSPTDTHPTEPAETLTDTPAPPPSSDSDGWQTAPPTSEAETPLPSE